MKKTVAKKDVKPKKAQTEPYKARIKILGRFYEATGETVKEAIENLKPEGVAKGVSVLTMSKGELKRDVILGRGQTFRLFSVSPLMREIAVKNTVLRVSI